MLGFWLWFGVLYTLDVAALLLCKAYVQTAKASWLILGAISFTLIIPVLAKLFRYESFSVANLTWSAANIIILPLIGWMACGDRLATAQIVGIGLTLVGLFLVHFK